MGKVTFELAQARFKKVSSWMVMAFHPHGIITLKLVEVCGRLDHKTADNHFILQMIWSGAYALVPSDFGLGPVRSEVTSRYL
jgi:hypothetical protein